MIVPTYQPGDWYAVVTTGTIAYLPPTTTPDVVQALWAAARDGQGLTAQLQVLLARPIAELPPFALLTVASGRVHAVVRGEVAVEVATAAGTRTVGAAQVATWTEEVVDDARAVTVGTAAGAAAEGDPGLPVLSAVVRVRTVRLELTSGAAPAGAGPGAAAATPAARVEQAQTAPLGVPVATPGRAHAASAVPQPREEADPAPAPAPASVPGPVPAAGPAAAPEQAHAPVRRPEPEPEASPEPEPEPGRVATEDHDGLTVLSTDVVALRRQMPRWAGDEVPGPLAVPDGRSRPPAKIVLSSGLVVSLNRPVLLGRAPQVSRVSNERMPRLVTVASPNQDISRTHCEVRQDGDDVLVTDLRSTNGVLLLPQGGAPQRLHPGEPTVVEPGVVVDLGEGVTFTVEHGT